LKTSSKVLDNLVLTGGTKLFKNALFLRTGPNEQNFSSIACDNQRTARRARTSPHFGVTDGEGG
jgi:hypothetical protein